MLIYYFLATLLPIEKVIGKLYPVFGICLIIMALGIGGATVLNSGARPMMEITLQNLHPAGKTIWPLMFITVACGAISGFHATQSPMMARCLTSEREGRKVFYGAMVAEGVIACPITSGDTAFRSARLTIADWFKIDQRDPKKHLALSLPLLVAGYLISFVDYNVIWRYFSWANQTFAMMALWLRARRSFSSRRIFRRGKRRDSARRQLAYVRMNEGEA